MGRWVGGLNAICKAEWLYVYILSMYKRQK